jgi:prepilin-type N-terminal cleavage/methylation domain-containing protein
MRTSTTNRQCAYSLIELVVVVMIIGMLASMAIPRMSRGAVAASGSSLLGDLTVVRTALLRYAIEHRNSFPGADAAKVVAQLTQYSDLGGSTSPTRTAAAIYGPYLLSIPPCPVGYNPDSNEILIDEANSPPKASGASSAGWVYNPHTGEFYPNASDEQVLEMLSGDAVATAIIVKGG